MLAVETAHDAIADQMLGAVGPVRSASRLKMISMPPMTIPHKGPSGDLPNTMLSSVAEQPLVPEVR
jgi:hypothetical protein